MTQGRQIVVQRGFEPEMRSAEHGFTSDMRSAEHGFTLIELLVALMIFAMLASAGVLLLGNSVSAQAQVKARLDDMAAVQRAGGALAGDLGQAVPRITRTEAGTLAPAFWAHDVGDAQPVMQFVRGGWDNLGDMPRPSLQKVEYWVRQGRLERRTYAQLDGAAGDDPAALLDNVEAVTLRFRDAQGRPMPMPRPRTTAPPSSPSRPSGVRSGTRPRSSTKAASGPFWSWSRRATTPASSRRASSACRSSRTPTRRSGPR